MATNVYMEALSPTMEEGRVVKWLKRDGDPVKRGETQAEVETDKAVMDLVARADGVLRQITAAEGQTVAVGSVVAVIAAPGESVGAAAASSPKPAPAPAPGSGERGAVPSAAVAADATRVKASPLARRIAKEAGVELKLVTGTGPGGRVTKRDLEARAVVAQPALQREVPLPAPRSPVVTGGGEAYQDVPLTQIRKTIAKRLATSLGPVPHFFLTTEVDMERANEARDALNKQLGDQGKVSFNDIIIKATAHALTKHPACNAWFQEDHIRYWNEVHIGMAVAVEDGLITPVIRNADLKSLAGIGGGGEEAGRPGRQPPPPPHQDTGGEVSLSQPGGVGIGPVTPGGHTSATRVHALRPV